MPTATSSSSSSLPKSPAPENSTPTSTREAPPTLQTGASDAQVLGKQSSKVSFSGNEGDDGRRASLGTYEMTPHFKSLGQERFGLDEDGEEGESGLKAAPPESALAQVPESESALSLVELAACLRDGSDSDIEKGLRAVSASSLLKLKGALEEVLATDQQESDKQEVSSDPEYRDDFEGDATVDSSHISKALGEDNTADDDEFESSKDP